MRPGVRGFTEICGSFGFIILGTAINSNPSRFFSKSKRLRRVAIRYDALASNFLAMVKLASRRLPLPSYRKLSFHLAS
jgi:hypothetical protein